ncbi:MAG: hypothetical protein Q8941_02970 [Bacteroidota bacterium]|nr:hypothetical protein [Bacteroidota bacterium]
MQAIVKQMYGPQSPDWSAKQKSLLGGFIDWCERQEKNRFLWLASGLAGHGCFLTPITLLAVMIAGNSMFLWALVISAMGMAVVTNLSALPTRITIPALFLSILIDLAVIAGSIMLLFR